MKILVFSDSHSYTDYMVECTRRIQPDAVIHLGDYYADADVFCREFPQLPLYAVPGNCDQYRGGYQPEAVAVVELDGIRFFLTHGHKHGVKYDLHKLKYEARCSGADAVLFGHTHQRLIEQEDDLWLVNPGSCGLFHSSAVLIVTENKKISHCEPISR